MWNDRLRFAGSVKEGWGQLDCDARAEARTLLERLDDDPICGVPLFEPVRGYWSLRTPGLRIVYRISPEARSVFVLSIEPAGKESA